MGLWICILAYKKCFLCCTSACLGQYQPHVDGTPADEIEGEILWKTISTVNRTSLMSPCILFRDPAKILSSIQVFKYFLDQFFRQWSKFPTLQIDKRTH